MVGGAGACRGPALATSGWAARVSAPRVAFGGPGLSVERGGRALWAHAAAPCAVCPEFGERARLDLAGSMRSFAPQPLGRHVRRAPLFPPRDGFLLPGLARRRALIRVLALDGVPSCCYTVLPIPAPAYWVCFGQLECVSLLFWLLGPFPAGCQRNMCSSRPGNGTFRL